MPPSWPFVGDSDAEEGLQSTTSSEKSSEQSFNRTSSSISQKSTVMVNLSVGKTSYMRSPEYQQRVECINSAEGALEKGEESASTGSSSLKETRSGSSWEEESSSDGGGAAARAGEAESRVVVVEAGDHESWSSRRRERSCEEEGEENEGCNTPRAKECMIPQVRFCPPAPRKRKPCLRLAFSPCHLSGLFAVPDFDAFFPLHHPIPLRE